MDSETRRRLELEATKYPITCCLPVLLAEHPGMGDYTNSGTMTLLASPNGIIGITCSHILEEYVKLALQGVNLLLEVGECKIDPNKHLISHNSALDLCTFSFTTQEYMQMKANQEIIGSNCISIIHRTPIQAGDYITIGGFPGQWRDKLNNTTFRFDSFSFAGCAITTSLDEHFTSRIDCLNKWPRTLDKHSRNIPSHPGGLSGGPILINKLSENGFFHWELVGIITDGHFFNDTTLLIYGVPARHIQPDGTIIQQTPEVI